MHIYLLDIPDGEIGQYEDSGGLNVDETDILDEIGTAQSLSSPPNSIGPPLIFEGADATMRALEATELLNSPHHAPLPVATNIDGLDGYYVASGATRRVKVSEGGVGVEKVDTTLVRAGTDGKLVRALQPAPYMADHEFGNDLEVLVALPTDARKVRWLDRDSGERELAAPVETVATAYGDVDVYDLEGALGYQIDPDNLEEPPLLVYEIAKDTDAEADVRLWDTRGHESLEADGRRQWQHVFSKDHEYDGQPVLDNGVLRVRLDDVRSTLEVGADETHEIDADESEFYNTLDVDEDGHLSIDEDGHLELAGGTGRLQAERWDDSTESWTDVDLETTQWTVWDIDVRSIGMVRDRVQVSFAAESGLFSLDLILQAGHEDALVTIPDGETGPIPEGLENLLEPIAAETVVDVQASKTLVSRNDVAR